METYKDAAAFVSLQMLSGASEAQAYQALIDHCMASAPKGHPSSTDPQVWRQVASTVKAIRTLSEQPLPTWVK